MPTYITSWNSTGQGIENIDHSPDRLDDASELVKSLGGELKGFHLTMGDMTSSPSPNFRTMTRLQKQRSGSVRLEQ